MTKSHFYHPERHFWELFDLFFANFELCKRLDGHLRLYFTLYYYFSQFLVKKFQQKHFWSQKTPKNVLFFHFYATTANQLPLGQTMDFGLRDVKFVPKVFYRVATDTGKTWKYLNILEKNIGTWLYWKFWKNANIFFQ